MQRAMPSDIAIYSHSMNEDEEDGREKKIMRSRLLLQVREEGEVALGGRVEVAARAGRPQVEIAPIDPRPPHRFTKMNECWANRM